MHTFVVTWILYTHDRVDIDIMHVHANILSCFARIEKGFGKQNHPTLIFHSIVYSVSGTVANLQIIKKETVVT